MARAFEWARAIIAIVHRDRQHLTQIYEVGIGDPAGLADAVSDSFKTTQNPFGTNDT